MTFIAKNNISADILGGISAGIVTLPVALAYGVATGLGPMAGMFTAVILGFLATIFGGTSTQISAPAGAMTVVISFIIMTEVAIWGSLEEAMPILVVIFILTGIIQMLLGIFKFGMNIRYVPFSVVSGFMSGIGVIIIVLQIGDVSGVYDSDYKSISSILMHLGYFFTHGHWQSALLALVTLLIIYLFPKLSKRIPSSLVALVVVSIASVLLEMDVHRLGEIKIEFVHLDLSYADKLKDSATLLRLGLAAISLAILGSINTLLSSVVADKMTQTLHNSNKELFGQGLGNLVASIAGGFPGSAATACTVANIQSGGRNRLSGLVSALFLLLVLLFGRHIAAQIPQAVLAGILVHIGVVLIDKETIKKMRKIPKSDNIIMLTVLILTVFWNLLYAVIIGLIFAAFYFMKKMADVVETDTSKTKIDSVMQQVVVRLNESENIYENILIKSIRGPVFFGFSSRFLVSMRNISENIKAVVFDMSMVPYMDHSGVRTFMEVIQFLNERDINICFTGVSDTNMKLLKGFDLVPKLVDEEHLFDSVEECIMWLHEPGHIENKFTHESELYISPAFTPNGDGANDDWVIKNIDKYPAVEVTIRNKKEEVVFVSNGYQQPWNGQLDGELLSTGEYKYVIHLNNEEKEVKEGSVFLFR